jgi:ferritin-like metal-binding protein YciE
VFETIGKRAQGKTCEAIQGIVEECEELLEEASEASPVCDASLIACGQAVEHYEMARYGALIAWGRVRGNKEAVSLLRQNLDQEKNALRNGRHVAHAGRYLEPAGSAGMARRVGMSPNRGAGNLTGGETLASHR